MAVSSLWRLPGDGPHREGDGPRPVRAGSGPLRFLRATGARASTARIVPAKSVTSSIRERLTTWTPSARAVRFRWACNKRFRQAITTFADNSRRASPWAAGIYAAARASGKDHPHAVRVLVRAWIRAIWRCWLDGVPYDPAKHGAAAALPGPSTEQVAA